jgi:dihydroneopterin aldolase
MLLTSTPTARSVKTDSPNAERRVRVFLINYVIDVSIGVYPWERKRRQKVRIDIEVTQTYATTPRTIEDVLDYNRIREGIRGIVDAGHVDLQETLCDKVLGMCLRLPGVQSAKVRVAKLEAFADCEAVGCEMIGERGKV